MPLPFFCTVCDKPIKPSKGTKNRLIHKKCMEEYLSNFDITTADEFNKNISTTKFTQKPKK